MTTSFSAKKQPIPFGKYLLLDRVNIGGMAEVWRGKTSNSAGFDRLVAIKRILPSIAEDEEFITMFIDEAKITVQLTHNNIAQIYELGQNNSSYFIAMEYIPGKDLRALFDRCRKKGEPAPVALTCYVISKVCEGLDYAHRKRDGLGREMNIVHRDVSPQNVLLSYEGEVKVIDFGIAKAAGKASKTQAGILKGKFGYMSPEQIRGVPIDQRSDIFAVGICLYELLTGERLFVGESDFSVLEKVRKAEFQPASTYNRRVPEALEKILSKALARETENRYQWANELSDDLQRFMLTSDVTFSRKDLVLYMQSTFADEVQREKERLAEYAEISVPVAATQQPIVVSPLVAAPASISLDVPQTTVSPPAVHEPSSSSAAEVELSAPSVVPVLMPRSATSSPRLHQSGDDDRQPTVLNNNRSDFADLTDPTLTRDSESGEPSLSAPGTVVKGVRPSYTSPTVSVVPSPAELRATQVHHSLAQSPRAEPAASRRWVYGLGAGAALFLILLTAILQHYRAPPSGLLLIEVPPEVRGKARVNINGDEIREPDGRPPRDWPLVRRALAGKGTVIITAPGFETFTQTVLVRQGQEVTTLKARLVSSGELVELRIVTDPTSAEIRIDGEAVTERGEVILKAGTEHLVEVKAPGFHTYSTRVAPRRNSPPVLLTAKLEPHDFPLYVTSSPSGATIVIGGREMGRTPSSVHVASGVTELLLRKRCYEPTLVPFKLPAEPHALITLSGSLRKQSSCR